MLDKFICLAEEQIKISIKEKNIKHSRKLLLFENEDVCMKKEGTFDIIMVIIDGADL